MASVGSDRVLIAASPHVNAGDAGVAYLFSLAEQMAEAPSLTIRLTPINRVAITWPSPSTGWTLKQNTNGLVSDTWSNVPGPIQDGGTTKTLIISPPMGERFFRLIKQ